MKKELFDLIYLAGCGVCKVVPDKAYFETLDLSRFYQLSKRHFLTALIGTSLKEAGIILPKEWEQDISKAVRKNILFDVEREKILSFMEQEGIWYMPLKGVVLKEFYPSVGMRQMSDNDILFDERFSDKVQSYMESQGYETIAVGKGNHDVYEKEPIYNFEMHRALYDSGYQKNLYEYYKNVKDKLVLNNGSSYGYHFTDEDYYVYILTHAYKHYVGSGTGLRTLLDFYVYLQAKEQEMDFEYIEKECKVLGIDDFERSNRVLCKKAFSVTNEYNQTAWEKQFSEEEIEMVLYYLSSGAYGTMEQRVENKLKDTSKFRYICSRLFPDGDTCKYYLPFCKYKWMYPLAWGYRAIGMLKDKERRERILRELKIVKKN